MYNPGNGQSAYWMQGTLEKRLDKYKVAKESNFTRNRFKVNKLSIVTHWGEKGEIPETVTVNLSKNTAWSLGNETEVSTTEEDEAITFEQGETCDTVKNEEKPPNPLLMEESEQKLLKIIGQTMLPTESPELRYRDVQTRDLEKEKESDDTEAVMKKQEESPDPLSMKELAMKLVTKEQKGGSDTLPMNELEKRCGRISAGPRQITNQANYKKD